MKTTRLFMVIFMVAVTAVLFAPNAKGQISELPFGSTEKVENYLMSNLYDIGYYVWARDYTNKFIPYFGNTWYIHSTMTKNQMDQEIRNTLASLTSDLLASTNTALDKSKGLLVYVDADANFNHKIGWAVFVSSYVYIIPTKSNDVYSVPDLSGVRMHLRNSIPFNVPNIKWGRLECGYVGDDYPSEVDDVRLDPTTDIVHSDGLTYLPTDIITDSSKTNGTHWLKLSLFSGTSFQNFDGDGQIVSNKPLRMNISVSNQVTTAIVSGGDSGRAYLLQQSSNMKNWTTCSTVNFVSPLDHLFPNGDLQSFVYQTTNTSMFFRTVVTNTPPY